MVICDWPLLFSLRFSWFFHVVICINTSFCIILFYGYTTFYLPIHILMDIWIVLTFWLLWIIFLWTFMYKFFIDLTFSYLLIIPRSGLLCFFENRRVCCWTHCFYMLHSSCNFYFLYSLWKKKLYFFSRDNNIFCFCEVFKTAFLVTMLCLLCFINPTSIWTHKGSALPTTFIWDPVMSKLLFNLTFSLNRNRWLFKILING